MTELPRLLNGKLEEVSRLHPVGLSITETLVPLSFATMHLLKDEMIEARRWVELFTPVGSAGIFRTRSPQTGIGSEDYTIELEHGIVELGDYIIPASIEGEMTCRKALQSIFEHYRGKKWKLGKVECTDKVVVDIDHDNLLQAVNDVLSQCVDYVMKFNFKTSPWTLTIVKKESTVTAEGRLSRNVRTATIKSNDEDLCTRIWIMGLDEKNKERYTYVNADTLSDYGIVEHVDFGSGYTKEQAELVANQYLETHKKPRVSVEISAIELSQATGEELDRFRPGKFFRLAIPSRDVIIEDVITSVAWSDVYNEPMKATVSLGDNRDSVLSFYQKQQSASKVAKKDGVKKSKEFQTYIRQTDSTIELHARRMGASESILKQAGLHLDSNGLLLYADDNENNIGSKIKQNADSISLVVEGTGKNAKIKPASIVASINGSTSQVMISADKIKLDGNVDLDSVLYVGNGMARFKKPVFFEGTSHHVSINNGKLTAGGGVQIGANQNLVFLEGSEESQAIRTITPTIAGNLIKSATVSGNVLTLTNVKGDTVNFSKATTLQVKYGGDGDTATYTVTANPQGNTVTGEFTVKVSKAAAYIVNPGGTVLARIDNDWYKNGWAAAYAKVSIPIARLTTKFTIKTPPSTVDGDAEIRNYDVVSESNNNNAVSVRCLDENGDPLYTIARLVHGQYTEGYKSGWGAAYGKVVLPGSSRAANFQVKTPPSTVDGSAVTTRYRLNEETDNTVAVSIVDDNDSLSYTIATLNHKQYDNGYDHGWGAARAKVTLPSGGTANSFDIKVPPSTVDGSATTLTYTLAQPSNNLITVTGNTAAGGYIVASINHGKYNAGIDSIDGDDITLQGYGTSPSSSKPSHDATWTTLSSGKKRVSAYIWIKRSNGTWAILRAFSFTEP